MAIEIIERGSPPEKRPWRGNCTNCRTKCKCLLADVRNITYDPKEGGDFGYITCPVCERDMIVYPETK